MPELILKRNNAIEPWDLKRVQKVIDKALFSINIQDESISEKISNWVESSINGNKIAIQEEVQNLVEQGLSKFGYFNAAKNFILYREERRKARESRDVFLDVTTTIDDYIGVKDWRVKENANVEFSFQGLILHLSGSMQAKYVLDMYPQEIRDAHTQGYFHIHDLAFGLTAYCCGWSLRDLLIEGFNLKGYCSSKPPKHLDSALAQIVNFIGTLQNEFAGAQAFNNLDTFLAPFIRLDCLTYKQVKQYVQRFIFNMNTTSRWGGQCPFSNVTLDLTCPDHLKNHPIIVSGKMHESLTYGQFQEEMNIFNKAFIEVMAEGDGDGRIFSFPIPTYNVTKDFPWDSEIGDMIAELTAKFGTPYFQNFINSDLKPEDIQSMCCRLRVNKKEVIKKTGGLFGSGDLTGSIGVVTLNLPKIAYLSQKDKLNFFVILNYYMALAKNSLELKRKMLNKYFDQGMYPFSKRYLPKGFNGHFSTIGLIGGHEAALNLLGVDLLSKEGSEFMVEVLNFMQDKVVEYQEETDNLYNLEATPAEGASYRLAKLDKKLYPEMIQSGNGAPYYTNSTQFHPSTDIGPINIIKEQEKFQVIYSGGTVVHSYLGEAVPCRDSVKKFIIKTFTETKIPYISITPTFSICEDHGYSSGEHFKCQKCGKDAEVYTRVTGYYRPVQRFHKGKRAEWTDRVKFTL